MKLSRKNARRLIWASGLSSIAAIGFFFNSRFLSRWLETSTSNEVLFHVNTTEKVVALTIDDGPHSELTPQILDILAEYDVRSTFFVIGSNIEGNEEIMERVVADGHELGNHLMSDARSIQLDDVTFGEQMAQAHQLIEQYGPVRWFRPGSGWYNARMLEQTRPYQYRTVVGSVYPFDAQIRSKEFASSYILSNTLPGSIIILHDGKDERHHTPEVLHRIIPTLQERGYRFVTLSELAEFEAQGK